MESANANVDTPKPCSGGCGFFGSAPLNYYCSVCFKKGFGEEEFKRRTEPPAPEKTEESTPPKAEEAEAMAVEVDQAHAATPEVAAPVAEVKAAEEGAPEPPKKGPTRCASCNKKVGLTGFVCRCGSTFCGTHRYSDKHECTFDYKTAGREQLSKANPIVEAAKLERI